MIFICWASFWMHVIIMLFLHADIVYDDFLRMLYGLMHEDVIYNPFIGLF